MLRLCPPYQPVASRLLTYRPHLLCITKHPARAVSVLCSPSIKTPPDTASQWLRSLHIVVKCSPVQVHSDTS